MNGKGISLLAIAVVAIGTFALPGTVSLFSGQHAWYDISGAPNEVPCEKCHADVAEEMRSPANGAHRNLTCAMCHRCIFTDYTYGSGEGDGSTPGKEAHAAATVECMHCHGIWHDAGGGGWNHFGDPEYAACWRCHGTPADWFARGSWDFISAGGFGIEDPANPGHNTTDTDTGEKAAHKTFVLDAIENEHMEGANEACIGCHTHVPVKINWTHAYSLEFDATYTPGGGYFVTNRTHFNVTNMSVNGTVNITSYGNASGGANTSYFPPPVTVWDE